MGENDKKEKVPGYELKEETTQTGLFIISPEGKKISEAELLVKIANDVSEIKEGTT